MKDLNEGKLTLHGRPEEFDELADFLGVSCPLPIQKKTRVDGKLSCPDAVILPNKKLPIVIDAKYYSSDISTETIRKTLDDMALRNTPYGLLVCSEQAGFAKFEQM